MLQRHECALQDVRSDRRSAIQLPQAGIAPVTRLRAISKCNVGVPWLFERATAPDAMGGVPIDGTIHESNEKRNTDVGIALKEEEERTVECARGEEIVGPAVLQAEYRLQLQVVRREVRITHVLLSEVEHFFGQSHDGVGNVTASGEPLRWARPTAVRWGVPRRCRSAGRISSQKP